MSESKKRNGVLKYTLYSGLSQTRQEQSKSIDHYLLHFVHG